MKRVVIFRLFLFLIVTISVICICKYGFYKETKVSFPNRKVEVCERENPYLKIFFPNESDCYIINVTKDQALCFANNKYYIGYWYEMHLALHVFFWILIAILIVYYVWSVITVYNCLYEDGHFCACDNKLCSLRCDLYNSINTYDLTPVKKGWLNFWGYSV